MAVPTNPLAGRQPSPTENQKIYREPSFCLSTRSYITELTSFTAAGRAPVRVAGESQGDHGFVYITAARRAMQPIGNVAPGFPLRVFWEREKKCFSCPNLPPPHG
jgi:hypothetical protein